MEKGDKNITKGEDAVDTGAPETVIGSSSSVEYEIPTLNLFKRLLQKIELESEPGTYAPGRWSNADLDPTPPEQQTWSTVNYIFYWTNDAIAPGNLRLGSSLMSLGLSWKLALVAIVVGNFLMAVGLTFNGVVGSRYHIPFTIQSRAPFGFMFSFVMVIVRMIVSAFWYGVNTSTGAECVHAILIAIWPSFADVPNYLPESAAITTQTMVSYFLYFLFVLPFHWIHPQKLRWFFAAKTGICFAAVIGMLIWACTATRNEGAGLDNSVFNTGNSVSGASLGWAFMNAVNAMMGNYGTIAVNINDFTRYAKNSRMTYVQLLVIPFAFLIMSFIGLVIVGAAEQIYGTLQWDVLDIMDNWTNTSGGRAGAVFAGAAMVIAQMGTNLGANCISAANDLNAMFPKYINIRRGSYLIAFVGAWVLVPWKILSSANTLVDFMDGYAIFLAPITGVLLADYWLIHRQHYDVRDLYDPHGRYSYNRYGTNWRAAVAWFLGWVPLVPGLANSINPANFISRGMLNFYDLGYHYGLSVAFIVYTSLSYAFPPKATMVPPLESEEI